MELRSRRRSTADQEKLVSSVSDYFDRGGGIFVQCKLQTEQDDDWEDDTHLIFAQVTLPAFVLAYSSKLPHVACSTPTRDVERPKQIHTSSTGWSSRGASAAVQREFPRSTHPVLRLRMRTANRRSRSALGNRETDSQNVLRPVLLDPKGRSEWNARCPRGTGNLDFRRHLRPSERHSLLGRHRPTRREATLPEPSEVAPPCHPTVGDAAVGRNQRALGGDGEGDAGDHPGSKTVRCRHHRHHRGRNGETSPWQEEPVGPG